MASLKTVLAHVVPLENPATRDLFAPFVSRFADSLRAHDPGCEYELQVIFNGGDIDAQTEAMKSFVDLPVKFDVAGRFVDFERVKFRSYTGAGCDVGSFLFAAKTQAENVFLVCCNTRVYAHRAGWLARLVKAREAFGPGLYATAVSREGGKLHACCRCFGIDSELLAEYPHEITHRDQGQFFETGDGSIFDWCFSQQIAWKLVLFDRQYDIAGVDICDRPETYEWCYKADNIYRRGDQSNMLVHDRHTDYYRDASPEEKSRLERMCFEGK